jgi:hypothetical protein
MMIEPVARGTGGHRPHLDHLLSAEPQQLATHQWLAMAVIISGLIPIKLKRSLRRQIDHSQIDHRMESKKTRCAAAD